MQLSEHPADYFSMHPAALLHDFNKSQRNAKLCACDLFLQTLDKIKAAELELHPCLRTSLLLPSLKIRYFHVVITS